MTSRQRRPAEWWVRWQHGRKRRHTPEHRTAPGAARWERAAAIAAAAAAATLLAAAGAGSEAERGLDSMLIAAAGQPRGGALRRRAERISAQGHRRMVARRLDALVERADRAPNRECFHAGLVRLHRWRMRR